ncbi:hypothetical protein V5O48_008370 [Marasmius crinis-equi]|uniref:GmrSD restriction endonucleases N-terminal domain-containing protein n=1 Tax=Marasmius crinis-equi TaxID=585013 RepID=A0ABR3FEF2_9AGAR
MPSNSRVQDQPPVDDIESDLTDIEDSDDEQDELEPSPQPPPPVQQPQPQATPPEPRRSTRTRKSKAAQEVEKWLRDGTIDLEAEYQRGWAFSTNFVGGEKRSFSCSSLDVVWTDQKQSNLVDSVINNYYIPPIIFCVKHDPKTRKAIKRICIDGKQRLTSIRRFMDGDLCHKDPKSGSKVWYDTGKVKGRKEMSKADKSEFESQQIPCVEYDDLTEDQEREIFARVQNGMALTPAERMQAFNGPYAALIRELARVVSRIFAESLSWGKMRGRDFQSVASVVFLIESTISRKPKAPFEPTTSKVEGWLNDNVDAKAVPQEVADQARRVFAVLCMLVTDMEGRRWDSPFRTTPKFGAIELVMVAYMIFVHGNEMTMKQLSAAVAGLRLYARGKFDDLRVNSATYKDLVKVIRNQKQMMAMVESAEPDRDPALNVSAWAYSQNNQARIESGPWEQVKAEIKEEMRASSSAGKASKKGRAALVDRDGDVPMNDVPATKRKSRQSAPADDSKPAKTKRKVAADAGPSTSTSISAPPVVKTEKTTRKRTRTEDTDEANPKPAKRHIRSTDADSTALSKSVSQSVIKSEKQPATSKARAPVPSSQYKANLPECNATSSSSSISASGSSAATPAKRPVKKPSASKTPFMPTPATRRQQAQAPSTQRTAVATTPTTTRDSPEPSLISPAAFTRNNHPTFPSSPSNPPPTISSSAARPTVHELPPTNAVDSCPASLACPPTFDVHPTSRPAGMRQGDRLEALRLAKNGTAAGPSGTNASAVPQTRDPRVLRKQRQEANNELSSERSQVGRAPVERHTADVQSREFAPCTSLGPKSIVQTARSALILPLFFEAVGLIMLAPDTMSSAVQSLPSPRHTPDSPPPPPAAVHLPTPPVSASATYVPSSHPAPDYDHNLTPSPISAPSAPAPSAHHEPTMPHTMNRVSSSSTSLPIPPFNAGLPLRPQSPPPIVVPVMTRSRSPSLAHQMVPVPSTSSGGHSQHERAPPTGPRRDRHNSNRGRRLENSPLRGPGRRQDCSPRGPGCRQDYSPPREPRRDNSPPRGPRGRQARSPPRRTADTYRPDYREEYRRRNWNGYYDSESENYPRRTGDGTTGFDETRDWDRSYYDSRSHSYSETRFGDYPNRNEDAPTLEARNRPYDYVSESRPGNHVVRAASEEEGEVRLGSHRLEDSRAYRPEAESGEVDYARYGARSPSPEWSLGYRAQRLEAE